MQDVDFRTVDEFLDFLPETEYQITHKLRQIILSTIPDVREKLSYNVPYYKRHRNICFLWPSAVPWGNVKQEGVRLGFTQGHLIQDDLHYLDRGQRKQVAWHDFHTLHDIQDQTVRMYLAEAVLLDEIQRGKK